MNHEDQLAREEAILEEQYQRGEITHAQLNEYLRDLHRQYRADCEEAAQQAYENERNNW